MATEALRKSHEIRTLRLDSDPGNLPPVHLINNFFECLVVPDDNRKRESLLDRCGQFTESEHDATVARHSNHRALRCTDLGTDSHRQGNTKRAIGARVEPAVLL